MKFPGFWEEQEKRKKEKKTLTYLRSQLLWNESSPHDESSQNTMCLTAHNWQKWRSTLLTCPCHNIYRKEALGLNNSNYTWKIMIFVKM